MDAVFRGVAVYGFLVLVFSVLGRRTLVQTTNFDLLLLIIIGQSTQLALLGDDYSVTNSILLIVTLLSLHLGLATLKTRMPRAQRILGGGPPIVVVDAGRMLDGQAHAAGVGEDDVLLAARKAHGLSRLSQVRYAIVERTGEISIVPMEESA